MRRLARAAAGALTLLVFAAGGLRAQGGEPLSLEVDPTDRRPVVRMRGMLDDEALQRALSSGLPLRFRLRLELWERRFPDQLVGSGSYPAVLVQDPLDGVYTLSLPEREVRVRGLREAERAFQASVNPSIRPAAAGRYYYLASLEVETLSLSDLDELRRWLRGEARPAVEGRSPVGRALERGVQRLFVRLMRLPTRRVEVRTPVFSAP